MNLNRIWPFGSAHDPEEELAAAIDELTSRLFAGEQVDLQRFVSEHSHCETELRRLILAVKVLADYSSTCADARHRSDSWTEEELVEEGSWEG